MISPMVIERIMELEGRGQFRLPIFIWYYLERNQVKSRMFNFDDEFFEFLENETARENPVHPFSFTYTLR